MADIRKNGKQYGLLCPKKGSLSVPKAINVFGNEEDSGEDDGTDWVKKALRAEGEKNRAKRQTRLNIEKALEEDPTICQYDEVFDDMKRTEERNKTKNKEVKKAKYIDNLLKTAERRKREQEHRIERMVQKEREAEGAMFADKESFVTSAYRAKLEEFKKMEKEEANMDRLEAIGDVTKQKDMSGFYRHFFHQTVAGENCPEAGGSEKKLNSEEKNPKNMDDADTEGEPEPSEQSSDSDGESETKTSDSKITRNSKKKSRQYRRRVLEASESESEINEPKINEEKEERENEEQIQDDKESEPAAKKKKMSQEKRDDEAADKNEKNSSTNMISGSKVDEGSRVNAKSSESTEIIDKVEERDTKPKVSIWEKRTVGPVFEAALQRYYNRKAMRLSGS